MRKPPILYIVIPCYNEEAVLPITSPLFLDKVMSLISKELISPSSRILYVNDGSTDNTWQLIEEFAAKDEHILGIAQSRNRGHQNAVLAGLMEAKDRCDITISIDCDGQDDINAMDEMILQYQKGYEIVYGVRNNRDTDTVFKRTTAQMFYKLLSGMGVECIYNHADYRLVSSVVLQEFAQFREVNLFLRGMIPLVGFPSTTVTYSRASRMAGSTHYPLSKMIALAIDGITSLSIRPIRIITMSGFFVAILSFLATIWAVITYFCGITVSGWSSMICIMSFLGGIQLLSVGMVGEYVGKIYLETKQRPRYIISRRTWEE